MHISLCFLKLTLVLYEQSPCNLLLISFTNIHLFSIFLKSQSSLKARLKYKVKCLMTDFWVNEDILYNVTMYTRLNLKFSIFSFRPSRGVSSMTSCFLLQTNPTRHLPFSLSVFNYVA